MHNGAYLVAARIADTDQEPSIAITSHHSQLSATRTCVEHRLKPVGQPREAERHSSTPRRRCRRTGLWDPLAYSVRSQRRIPAGSSRRGGQRGHYRWRRRHRINSARSKSKALRRLFMASPGTLALSKPTPRKMRPPPQASFQVIATAKGLLPTPLLRISQGSVEASAPINCQIGRSDSHDPEYKTSDQPHH